MTKSTAQKVKDKEKIIQRFKAGDIDLPEAMASIKGLRKNWSARKIQKRAAWRRRTKKAWDFRNKIPMRPLGGLIADAGALVEAGVAKLQDMKIS